MLMNICQKTAAAEHYVLSHIEGVIPQSVKTFWHNYRQALKDAEKEQLGDNQISEDVEMVGWGVKEAEEKNQSEASEYLPFLGGGWNFFLWFVFEK